MKTSAPNYRGVLKPEMAEAALASGLVMCFKTHNTNLFQYFHINNNYKLSTFDSSKNAPR